MIVNRHAFLTEDRRGYMFCTMRYGERLKAARTHAELTQTELAERCGIAQPTISELEATDGGSAYTTRLARACGVSPDWLADEIGEMKPSGMLVTDPKLLAGLKVMMDLPEYGRDAALKTLAATAQLIEHAKTSGDTNGDGTNG